MLSGPPSSSTPEFDLEVIDATINLEHKGNVEHKGVSLTSTLQPVSMVMQLRHGSVGDLELTIGNVPSPDEASLQPPTDWLAFRFGDTPTQDGVASTKGAKHLRLKANNWKLDRLLPALARWEPKAELVGTLDADARSQIDLSGTEDWTQREWSWDGRVTAKSFVLAGISALKQDRVSLELTSVAGRLAAQQGRLSMQDVQLKTEVGELTATGDIVLAGLAVSPLNAIRSVLSEQDYTIHGHVNLQKLAALMPTTLRVREGTEITAGRIDIDLKSEVQGAARQWTADATVDHLAARHEGPPITWKEHLLLNMKAHKDAGKKNV
jgi:hypothetical protein